MIDHFADPSFVDPAGDGTFMVYGRPVGSNRTGLLSIDPAAGTITPLVSEDDVIDDFVITYFEPAEVDGFGLDGVPVYSAFEGLNDAVGKGTSVVARSGDLVGDLTLDEIDLPRRTASGDVFFRADGNLFRTPVGGIPEFHHGSGETIALQPVLSIEHYGVNNTGHTAYQAELLGQRSGVFVDNTAVAIAEVTSVDGVELQEVGYGNDDRVSINDQGQVAFFWGLMMMALSISSWLPRP